MKKKLIGDEKYQTDALHGVYGIACISCWIKFSKLALLNKTTKGQER